MTFSTTKDPQAVLDYQFDWTLALGGDSITDSSWVSSNPSELVVDSDSNTVTHTTVWVSGGVAGSFVELTNTIVTSVGRTLERTLVIKIQNR